MSASDQQSNLVLKAIRNVAGEIASDIALLKQLPSECRRHNDVKRDVVSAIERLYNLDCLQESRIDQSMVTNYSNNAHAVMVDMHKDIGDSVVKFILERVHDVVDEARTAARGKYSVNKWCASSALELLEEAAYIGKYVNGGEGLSSEDVLSIDDARIAIMSLETLVN
ncbi:hypothetical protein [Paramagnetospirillum magnetotacticum]|uniref:hypothetical protein n=1 Tax=Paramagnetospirillum magnetotacticum TaxID=188 RepID=UPI0005973698|nr:hypothetical protein [Paramagnetospirillum magnetotacticum]